EGVQRLSRARCATGAGASAWAWARSGRIAGVADAPAREPRTRRTRSRRLHTAIGRETNRSSECHEPDARAWRLGKRRVTFAWLLIAAQTRAAPRHAPHPGCALPRRTPWVRSARVAPRVCTSETHTLGAVPTRRTQGVHFRDAHPGCGRCARAASVAKVSERWGRIANY